MTKVKIQMVVRLPRKATEADIAEQFRLRGQEVARERQRSEGLPPYPTPEVPQQPIDECTVIVFFAD